MLAPPAGASPNARRAPVMIDGPTTASCLLAGLAAPCSATKAPRTCMPCTHSTPAPPPCPRRKPPTETLPTSRSRFRCTHLPCRPTSAAGHASSQSHRHACRTLPAAPGGLPVQERTPAANILVAPPPLLRSNECATRSARTAARVCRLHRGALWRHGRGRRAGDTPRARLLRRLFLVHVRR